MLLSYILKIAMKHLVDFSQLSLKIWLPLAATVRPYNDYRSENHDSTANPDPNNKWIHQYLKGGKILFVTGKNNIKIFF
jgi:hypothetical protein